MSRRNSSIVAATCPRCDGALDLDEAHDRFFTCSSCGTSLEDTEYGKGSPQVVNVTVVGAQPKPLSRRAKIVLGVGVVALLAGIVALAILDGDDDRERDRITLGSITGGGADGLRVLATGRTFDDVVRAVYAPLDGGDGWTVDVADGGSTQTRAAFGEDTAYFLLDRRLIALSTADGSERFRIDLPNDLACPECMVASGPDGRHVTLSLNGGTVVTHDGADGSLLSEIDVGPGSYSLVVAGDAVAFTTAAGSDAALADPADLAAATALGLDCPPPFELPDDLVEEGDDVVDDLLITAHDGDVLIQFDDCLGRWTPDGSNVWRRGGLRAFQGFSPGSPPDIVGVRGEDGLALVDLADGATRALTIEPSAAQVVGRDDGTTTAVVREDGVWSIVGLDQESGELLWRKTPPGDFELSYRPGILQEFTPGVDASWLAGAAGPVAHQLWHDGDRNVVGVQQIDVRTGTATEEVRVSYADDGATGVRSPVVLGFTEQGVVLTLDDRITHLDTATGEVLAEA